MELKWLEDFLSVARTRSFSRSAEERHVTQSAFSRRIQALETWLGVALIDRSTYPTTLTPAGREFRETAEEAVRTLHGSRAGLQERSRPTAQTVAFAALHSLALAFFPRWFREIQARTGLLNSRLLPDDFHSCIQAVVEGGYDFLLTFYHANVPIPLDAERFPHRLIGMDSLVAVHSPSLRDDGTSLPLLAYAQNSFLGRLTTFTQTSDPPATISHINENAMAEALKVMALEGHGLARLPRSLVARELAENLLVTTGEATPLEVRLYRNAAHRRASVVAVWNAAETLAGETMQAKNRAV